MNENGLRKMDDLEFPSRTRRYYVVVTHGGVRPKITVPLAHFVGQGRWKVQTDKLSPVYHYPIRMVDLLWN